MRPPAGRSRFDHRRPEIHGSDNGVISDLRRGTVENDTALMHDERAIGERSQKPHHMLDENHRQPAGFQAIDEIDEFVRFGRGKPANRFIEKQYLRFVDERCGDHQFLADQNRHVFHDIVGEILQLQPFKRRPGPLPILPAGEEKTAGRLAAESNRSENVVEYAQPVEAEFS